MNADHLLDDLAHLLGHLPGWADLPERYRPMATCVEVAGPRPSYQWACRLCGRVAQHPARDPERSLNGGAWHLIVVHRALGAELYDECLMRWAQHRLAMEQADPNPEVSVQHETFVNGAKLVRTVFPSGKTWTVMEEPEPADADAG